MGLPHIGYGLILAAPLVLLSPGTSHALYNLRLVVPLPPPPPENPVVLVETPPSPQQAAPPPAPPVSGPPVVLQETPEPASLALAVLGGGFGGVAWLRKRGRKKEAPEGKEG